MISSLSEFNPDFVCHLSMAPRDRMFPRRPPWPQVSQPIRRYLLIHVHSE